MFGLRFALCPHEVRASTGTKKRPRKKTGVTTLEPVETVVASLIKNLKSKTVSHEDIFELAADAHSNPPYLTRIRKALKKEGITVLEKSFLEKKKEDDQSAAIRKLGDTYNRTRLTPRVKWLLEKWTTWTR